MAYFGTSHRIDPRTRVLFGNSDVLSYSALSTGRLKYKTLEFSALRGSNELHWSFGECLALPLADDPHAIAPSQPTRRPLTDGGSTCCGRFQIFEREAGPRAARLTAIGRVDSDRHHFSQAGIQRRASPGSPAARRRHQVGAPAD